jgi:hypothetical protein
LKKLGFRLDVSVANSPGGHVGSARDSRALPHLRAWRLPLAAFGFLALMLQSFVIQTHIHIPQSTGKAQTVSLITLAAAAFAEKAHAAGDVCVGMEAPRDKYPIGEDPSNCPLCQEVTNSGAYLHNAAALSLLPPSANAHLIVFEEPGLCAFRTSHIWQGRAPPSA